MRLSHCRGSAWSRISVFAWLSLRKILRGRVYNAGARHTLFDSIDFASTPVFPHGLFTGAVGRVTRTAWVADFIKGNPSALCLLECRSFRRLDDVQGLWTSTAERSETSGRCQTETQRRAQRRPDQGREQDGRASLAALPPSQATLTTAAPPPTDGWQGPGVGTGLHQFLSCTVRLHSQMCCLNSLQECS